MKSYIYWDITPCRPLKVKLYIPEDRTVDNHSCENLKTNNQQPIDV